MDLQKFKAGDEATWKEVFHLYFKPLTYFIKKRTFDLDLSREIVSDCFCRLFKHRNNINDNEHIKSSLYTIAKNLAIDKQRENKMQEFDEIIENHISPLQTNNDYNYIEFILNEVACAIEELAPRQKEVIILKLFKEKSTPEIANELSISTQSVLNNYSLGINSLRHILIREGKIKNVPVPWTPAPKTNIKQIIKYQEKVFELMDKGFKNHEIQKMFNKTSNMIGFLRHKYKQSKIKNNLNKPKSFNNLPGNM